MLEVGRPNRVRKPFSDGTPYGFFISEDNISKNDYVDASAEKLAENRDLRIAQDDICVNIGENPVGPLRGGSEDVVSICSRSSSMMGGSEGTSHTSLADEMNTPTVTPDRNARAAYPTPQPASKPQTPIRKIQQMPSFAGVVDLSNLPPTPDSLLTTPVFNLDISRKRRIISPEIPAGEEEDVDTSDSEEEYQSGEGDGEGEWEDVEEEDIEIDNISIEGSESNDEGLVVKNPGYFEGSPELERDEEYGVAEDTNIFPDEDDSDSNGAYTPKLRQKLVASPEFSPLQYSSEISPLPSPTLPASPSIEIQESSSDIASFYLSDSSPIMVSTPADMGSPAPSDVQMPLHTAIPQNVGSPINPEYRAKSSILGDMKIYANECVKAALNNRLSPYALHEGEYRLLRDHLSSKHVTTYLNIRNGILRLWSKNSRVRVTQAEAAGCAKDERFFGLADFAYEWLVRNGYINHGCLELQREKVEKHSTRRRKVIAIIGAGISGLAAARQLESILAQYGESLMGPEYPEIVIFEGRQRLGGRVYSHYLEDGPSDLPGDRKAAIDVGGQIVMGYEGNPLAALIQKQLELPYNEIDSTTALPIYDFDGQLVNNGRDQIMQDLHDDMLDRLASFKHKYVPAPTAEGNQDQINRCKDPWGDGGPTIAAAEKHLEKQKLEGVATINETPDAAKLPSSKTVRKRIGKRKSSEATGAPASKKQKRSSKKVNKASLKALKFEVEKVCDDAGFGSLGKSMDNMLPSYGELVEPDAQDLRLYNWYQANLEYCNAASVNKPSLEHWDQDDGNEFTGAHSMIIGGYSQLARGLFTTPSKLDVRTRREVTRIKHDPSKKDKGVTLKFKDGSEFTADRVIVTLPLGVLKQKSVQFDPPLSTAKESSIDRLGFGLLNKVILIYENAFWDTTKDGFGCLRQAEGDESLLSSYEAKRGRFYMWWNATKIAGRPTLVGLMVGDAAEQTETDSDDGLVKEATNILKRCFGSDRVPEEPKETIVTRWRKDPFARGTYSYVAAGSSGEDYDTIATPIEDQVFFAGEHTNRHFPATVHGAYISGLRVASEVAESLLGPINIPSPLIRPRPRRAQTSATPAPAVVTASSDVVPITPTDTTGHNKRKAEESPEPEDLFKKPRLTYDQQLQEDILEIIGEKPVEPTKETTNPFLVYQKTHFPIAKARADANKQNSTGNLHAKAERDEVRAVLGKMWRDETLDGKKPYLEKVQQSKVANKIAEAQYQKKLKEWEKARQEYMWAYGAGCPMLCVPE
ncbi:hypothetical protein ABW19_dt0202122 [Dactylella cylindrospora]|nr:hypothetical protein ABW19_dt0202122 [Dactylella cylindrospora]